MFNLSGIKWVVSVFFSHNLNQKQAFKAFLGLIIIIIFLLHCFQDWSVHWPICGLPSGPMSSDSVLSHLKEYNIYKISSQCECTDIFFT